MSPVLWQQVLIAAQHCMSTMTGTPLQLHIQPALDRCCFSAHSELILVSRALGDSDWVLYWSSCATNELDPWETRNVVSDHMDPPPLKMATMEGDRSPV